jgi:hypothetical protein
MTAHDFFTNFDNVRCLLARQQTSELWDNVARKWVPIPADGSIPKDCLMVPSPMATKGKLRRNFQWTTDLDPSELVTTSLLIFAADGLGNLGDQAERVPAPYFSPQPFASGGWVRW